MAIYAMLPAGFFTQKRTFKLSLTLTEQSIITYTRRMLGEPVIEVELTDEQIKEFIAMALDVYGNYKPIEKINQFSVIAEQQKYILTASQVGRGIIEVFKKDMLRQPISLEQFDVFKYHTHLPNLDPGDFYQERVWWQEVRRSAGTDDDWTFELDPTTGGGVLYISPIPSESYQGTYIYVDNPSLGEVPKTDDQWVKDYSLAMCKEVLGEIRRKFDGVDGQESALRMNGSALVSEGSQKRKELEEYLIHRGQFTTPIRG